MTVDGTPLRGMTWEHPRGYAALDELTRLDETGEAGHGYGAVPVPLRWDRQPLSGFESHPVAELAQTYDVVVADHPGLADAVLAGALVPMDDLFTADELAGWRAEAVGPSFDSYRYAGRGWALPLDAATQVCVVRPDLLAAPPVTWDDVRELARTQPIALCLGGPHALLTLLSLVATMGPEPYGGGGGAFLRPDTGAEAVAVLSDLWTHADRELSLRNPIGVLDAMAAGADSTDAVCCPLVYGYVTYALPPPGRHRLRASDAPRWHSGGRPGSVLGGTGLAVSAPRVGAEGERADAVRAHLRRLMSEPVQVGLAARVGAQPSAYAAWTSAEVNARWGSFYRDTLATVEAAWVRPRRPGWVGFQDRASAIVRDGLVAGDRPGQVIRTLNDMERRWPWTKE